MANYLVKTVRGNNYVVKADEYEYNPVESAYEFYRTVDTVVFPTGNRASRSEKVATVRASVELLMIVRKKTEEEEDVERV